MTDKKKKRKRRFRTSVFTLLVAPGQGRKKLYVYALSEVTELPTLRVCVLELLS